MNLSSVLNKLLVRFRWWHRPPSKVYIIPRHPIIEFPDSGTEYVAEELEPIITEPRSKRGVQPGAVRGPYEAGKLRREIADIVELVLDRFDNFDIQQNIASYPRESIKLVEELLGNDFWFIDNEEDIIDRMKGGSKYSPGRLDEDEATPSELADAVWPVSIGAAKIWGKENAVQLHQIETIDPKSVRGRVTMVVPKMCRYIFGSFYSDNTWWCSDIIVGLVGNKWTIVSSDISDEYKSKRNRENVHNKMTLLIAGVFNIRYNWNVAFGSTKHGLRLVLPTNPTMALKLFRDRELLEGQNRREALKHWVEHFYRDDKEQGTVYIRDHLRGNTNFSWNQMPCELMVSAYDLEKNEFFKKEAHLWRANRKHNRVRVRVKKK